MKQFEKIIDKLKERRVELELRLNKIEQNLRMPYDKDSEEQALEREEDDVLPEQPAAPPHGHGSWGARRGERRAERLLISRRV